MRQPYRRLVDETSLADPEHWREGSGPEVLSRCSRSTGSPAGYALYRIASKWEQGTPHGEVRVVEALATSPESTAELWRFLFGIDLVVRVKGDTDPAWPLLPHGHRPSPPAPHDRRRALAAPRRPRRRAPRALAIADARACRARDRGRSVPAERGSLVDRSRARPNRRGGRRRARRRRSRLRVPRRVHVRASRRCRPGSRAAAGRARARDRALRDAAATVLPEGF